MALMHLTVIPFTPDGKGLSKYVAAIQREIEKSALPFRLTDMGTDIEGPALELFRLAARLHELPFAHGIQRVVTSLQIDDRRDKSVSLGDKIESVKSLG